MIDFCFRAVIIDLRTCTHEKRYADGKINLQYGMFSWIKYIVTDSGFVYRFMFLLSFIYLFIYLFIYSIIYFLINWYFIVAKNNFFMGFIVVKYNPRLGKNTKPKFTVKFDLRFEI